MPFDQDEITVSLNGAETNVLMELIAKAGRLGIVPDYQKATFVSILEKFGPQIMEKAAKQEREMRKGLN